MARFDWSRARHRPSISMREEAEAEIARTAPRKRFRRGPRIAKADLRQMAADALTVWQAKPKPAS